MCARFGDKAAPEDAAPDDAATDDAAMELMRMLTVPVVVGSWQLGRLVLDDVFGTIPVTMMQ